MKARRIFDSTIFSWPNPICHESATDFSSISRCAINLFDSPMDPRYCLSPCFALRFSLISYQIPPPPYFFIYKIQHCADRRHSIPQKFPASFRRSFFIVCHLSFGTGKEHGFRLKLSEKEKCLHGTGQIDGSKNGRKEGRKEEGAKEGKEKGGEDSYSTAVKTAAVVGPHGALAVIAFIRRFHRPPRNK